MSSAAPSNTDFQRTSQGPGFVGWVKEKPWHFWITVVIAIVGLYITWKIWQGQSAATGSAGTTTSQDGVLGEGAVTLTDTTGGSGSTSGTTTPTTAKPFWQNFLGANPLDTLDEGGGGSWFTVGESQAPNLTTLSQIAKAFHLQGGTKDLTLNPHNTAISKDTPSQQLVPGTQVWVTTSTINPNMANALG